MASPAQGDARPADWLRPRIEQQALQRYLSTLRERLWLIVLAVVLTTAAAALYVTLAEKVWEADADILVTPVPRDDETLTGLGLIQDSSDPTRDIETAARLVATTEVATRVRRELGLATSVDALLEAVSAAPVAQSNIVAVTARAGSPEAAARLANAFAEQAVENRSAQLRAQLDRTISRLRSQVEQAEAGSEARADLRGEVAQLQALRSSGDPTVRVQTQARVPRRPVAPRPLLSIVAGVLAGLAIGIGGAFALQVFDPRLRREDQLRLLYRLPILARIPIVKKHGEGAIAPQQLSPVVLEAYRTLRATLAASRPHAGSRAVLVTSASASEGKTTTAINLASSLALAGHRVILVEVDLRRPSIGKALGETPEYGTGDVLLEMASFEDALVTTAAYRQYLRLLLADEIGAASGSVADRLFLPAAQRLVTEAKARADYVIIDSPPIAEVIDALPLAQLVDDVLVVTHLGRTQLPKLRDLGELLARHGVEPIGFAVVGVPESSVQGYYYAAYKPKEPRRAGTEQEQGVSS